MFFNSYINNQALFDIIIINLKVSINKLMTDFEDIKINLENNNNQGLNNFEFFNNDDETHNQANSRVNNIPENNFDYNNIEGCYPEYGFQMGNNGFQAVK